MRTIQIQNAQEIFNKIIIEDGEVCLEIDKESLEDLIEHLKGELCEG